MCSQGTYWLVVWVYRKITTKSLFDLWSSITQGRRKVQKIGGVPLFPSVLFGFYFIFCLIKQKVFLVLQKRNNRVQKYVCCIFDRVPPNWTLLKSFGFSFKTEGYYFIQNWTKSKLYIPSTLNIDLILWHTQLIVCAVKC